MSHLVQGWALRATVWALGWYRQAVVAVWQGTVFLPYRLGGPTLTLWAFARDLGLAGLGATATAAAIQW